MKKIDKYIDISNIKRYNKQLDWKHSIGCRCGFKYGDIEGEAILLGSTPNKVQFSINEYCYELYKTQFVKAGFGKMLSNIYDYTYDVGQEINNIKILSKTRLITDKHSYRAYEGICSICGDKGIYLEDSIRRGLRVCKVCNGKKVLPGYNDIATTDAWMMKYLANKEDATKYKSTSSIIIETRCPFCGHIGKTSPYELKRKGHDSCKCSNKGYYSERFFSSVLDQLNIDYIQQATHNDFEWIGRYKYDFWFEVNNQTYIVETNGIQHYEQTNNKHFNLKEIQENDKRKKLLANSYVDNFIQLDCRKSKRDFVKTSIMSSELPSLLGFSESDIDWDSCHSIGSKFLYKQDRRKK